MDCPLCERVKLLRENKYPFLIHEFSHSYLMLGEHQYYEGYCVLVTKNHHREMSDISSPEREEIFKELMISSKALQSTLLPKKMNLCSLGNVVDHLHWHLFPRFENDPLFKNPPWLQMNLFESAKTDLTKSHDLIQSVKMELLGLC